MFIGMTLRGGKTGAGHPLLFLRKVLDRVPCEVRQPRGKVCVRRALQRRDAVDELAMGGVHRRKTK
jgi:hypothetical protein